VAASEPSSARSRRDAGEDHRGGSVADGRAVLPAKGRGHREVPVTEVGLERLGAFREGREGVVGSERVRAMHQTSKNLGFPRPTDLSIREKRLGHERNQGGHGESEAPLGGIDRLGHDCRRFLGGDGLHALARDHEDVVRLAASDFVTSLVERRGSCRRGGLGTDGRNPDEPEAVRDLRGDVGAALELLDVHDPDLDRVEGADGRLL
jgi:hypothetical protein